MSVINYSVCVFCTLCRHNTALQGLNLEDNRIGDAGAAAIGEGLGYDDCSRQTCSSVFARHSFLNLRDSGSLSLIYGTAPDERDQSSCLCVSTLAGTTRPS